MPFTWRNNGGTVRPLGSSIRYSAIVLIGLQSAVSSGLLDSNKGESRDHLKTLKRFINQVDNYGDMGLILFGAAIQGDEEIQDLIERSWQLMEKHSASKNNVYETMWLAWLLDGFCAAAKLMPKNAVLLQRARHVANRLLSNQELKSGLFHRTRNWGNFIGRIREQISFFCDQVYPVHALSSAYMILGENAYLSAANQCAQQLKELQGPSGEWWWIYNVPKGKVAEPFPVYSVHQYGMAPMALTRLRQAGGLNLETSCAKGISWLAKNQLKNNMVDEQVSLIWRSHRRAHLGRLITSYNQISSIFGIFPNSLSSSRLQIDWECRPYELGWLLYANSLIHGGT